jgi:FkbM family methyltransferase
MDFKVHFKQFSLWPALKLIGFTAVNRLLNPYGYTYYGHVAEDVVISKLLGNPNRGFYVDVGCHHPIRFSNSFAFYFRGWNGITIDANAVLINQHRKIRPKDISINCAASDKEEKILFTQFEDDSLSSISRDFINKQQRNHRIISETELKTRTLNSILKENNCPSKFEFLSIDVEGHDYEVLRGVDLNEYHPKLIIIEIQGLHYEKIKSSIIYNYLDNQGYEFVAYYGINAIFLSKSI